MVETHESLENQISKALKSISRNQAIKTYLLENTPLYNVLLRAARRFIGGEVMTDCIATAKILNQQGFAVTIDYMGENTHSVEITQEAVQEFLRVIQAIEKHHLNASISLDLSHIGLAINKKVAAKNLELLGKTAHNAGLEIMISMEGSEQTDDILQVYHQLSEQFSNLGITLQANLKRTDSDLTSALKSPGKIRLVKGAYLESESCARPKGEAVDEIYRKFMNTLLTNGHLCSIATHDQAILNRAHSLIQKTTSSPQLEFEMLYGIGTEHLKNMKNLGYRTRVYLPYGKEWYLYLCHRIAEHPPNLYQVLVDAVG